MKEVWIEGYSGRYSVNEAGEVISNPRRGGGTHTNSRLVLKGQVSKNGYRFVTLSKNGSLKRFSVHRLVATHLVSPQPSDKHQVNHKNGDKLDNRAENLEWVTCSENQLHAQRLWLSANGERSRLAKLTEAQVLQIRSLYKPREYPANRLAKEFGMSESGIFHIVKGESWKYIKTSS